MRKIKRIAITGIGPICSCGIGKEQIWSSITKGRTGLKKESVNINGKISESYFIHRVKNFNLNNLDLDESKLKEIKAWADSDNSIDLLYLIATIKLAIYDAKLKNLNSNVGVVLAHENPGHDEFYKDFIDESYKIFNSNRGIKKSSYFNKIYMRFYKNAYNLQTFMFLFYVTKFFGIHGYSLFINNACSSGLFAIEAAADIIRSGKCNTVIVAASDRWSIFKQLWFKSIGMYAEDGKTKPFDKNANGFVLGEGGAGIVLEDLQSARKRKARIYAEYAGGAFGLEGWKITMPNITSSNYRDTVNNALINTYLRKDQVDLIIPHGVGTRVTDLYEEKALKSVFINTKPIITTIKPYIGHTLGASSILEAAIAIIYLEKNKIPKTLNYRQGDLKSYFTIANKNINYNINVVLKLACGFAGYNAALIFKKI